MERDAGGIRRSPVTVRLGRTLVGAVRLIHPFPVTVVVGTSLLLVLVAHHGNPGWNTLWRAGAVVLLSQIAIGALNDLIDRDLDRLAQPSKPIPSGLVSPSFALGEVLLSLAAFVPLALTFGVVPFCLIALGTAAGLAYDLWLKPTLFSLAGYLVGFLSLITWIWAIAGHITRAFVLVYPAGTLLLLAAHLAQSFPDIETDRGTGQHGLASRLGPAITFHIIVGAVSSVSAVALVLTVALSSRWGALLACIGLALAAYTVRLRSRALGDRDVRRLVFFLIAPAIAATVLGSLIALQGA